MTAGVVRHVILTTCFRKGFEVLGNSGIVKINNDIVPSYTPVEMDNGKAYRPTG